MIEQKDRLAEVFDIEPLEHKPIIDVKPNPIQRIDDDVESDYEYTRSNLYDLIDQGKSAVHGILSVANESQHPRAYEVAATLIKNLGDVNDKLMNLHKLKKELVGQKQETQITVDKAIFVGSTADLLKKVRNNVDSES